MKIYLNNFVATLAWFLLISPLVFSSEGSSNSFKNAFLSAIRHADYIIFIEHSDTADFNGLKEFEYRSFPSIEYGRKKLNKKLTDAFYRSIWKMPEKDVGGFLCDGFVPHHSIEFYKKNKLSSKMMICFQCEEIKWGEIELNMPYNKFDVFRVLENVLNTVEFKSKRDWKKLAKEKVEQSNEK